MALADLLKSMTFNKKSYTLLSNGKNDSIKAEKLVKSLEDCKINHARFFEHDDPIGRNLGVVLFTYPTLYAFTFRQTQKIVGYEAIEKYINKIDVKKYLMTWLILEAGVGLFAVSKIAAVSFF